MPKGVGGDKGLPGFRRVIRFPAGWQVRATGLTKALQIWCVLLSSVYTTKDIACTLAMKLAMNWAELWSDSVIMLAVREHSIGWRAHEFSIPETTTGNLTKTDRIRRC